MRSMAIERAELRIAKFVAFESHRKPYGSSYKVGVLVIDD